MPPTQRDSAFGSSSSHVLAAILFLSSSPDDINDVYVHRRTIQFISGHLYTVILLPSSPSSPRLLSMGDVHHTPRCASRDFDAIHQSETPSSEQLVDHHEEMATWQITYVQTCSLRPVTLRKIMIMMMCPRTSTAPPRARCGPPPSLDCFSSEKQPNQDEHLHLLGNTFTLTSSHWRLYSCD
ncbi:hypothetical protein PAXRUDRAFT_828171 [Paxillus rubicundulus Ve08.2h10]|uniref:Uncharacterized protein n=1 Tax=Paxillus rubicundulus Ve08.2h10 TaxID=930991 RepID=A0A0D0E1L4_9AGAM|nr:hypothetical protein PAXRUDRAFT_828171 [Paxillus rubicundulus Ve08.2h10]